MAPKPADSNGAGCIAAAAAAAAAASVLVPRRHMGHSTSAKVVEDAENSDFGGRWLPKCDSRHVAPPASSAASSSNSNIERTSALLVADERRMRSESSR